MSDNQIHRPQLSYLASPYMHEDLEIRAQRFRQVAYVGAQIMKCNDHVICPITMCHPMTVSAEGLPGDFEFWGALDHNLIYRCDRLLLTPLDGWLESRGMRAEVAIAKEYNKEILIVSLGAGLRVLEYRLYKGECDG